MKKIRKVFLGLIISTLGLIISAISVYYFFLVFIGAFFYDNIQYKQIGNTNFYLRPNEQGESTFLCHDGGTKEVFVPISHEGTVHDVYWNQQYIIIKCSHQKEENWYIIRNIKDYSYPNFKIQHLLNEDDYKRSLDSLGISEKNMEHTDGTIPWSLHL